MPIKKTLAVIAATIALSAAALLPQLPNRGHTKAMQDWPHVSLIDQDRNGSPDVARTYLVGPGTSLSYITERQPTQKEIDWYKSN